MPKLTPVNRCVEQRRKIFAAGQNHSPQSYESPPPDSSLAVSRIRSVIVEHSSKQIDACRKGRILLQVRVHLHGSHGKHPSTNPEVPLTCRSFWSNIYSRGYCLPGTNLKRMQMRTQRAGPSRTRRNAKHRGPLRYGVLESPIGRICVALNGRTVIAVGFRTQPERNFRTELSERASTAVSRSDESVQDVLTELKEYFEGTRRRFSFSVDLFGLTDFQRTVLQETAKIPWGETRTYGWLAERVGSPGAARAVGQVMAANPVPIIIPCHRVIGSTGKLCGFGGGAKDLETKRKLLALEAVTVREFSTE